MFQVAANCKMEILFRSPEKLVGFLLLIFEANPGKDMATGQAKRCFFLFFVI